VLITRRKILALRDASAARCGKGHLVSPSRRLRKALSRQCVLFITLANSAVASPAAKLHAKLPLNRQHPHLSRLLVSSSFDRHERNAARRSRRSPCGGLVTNYSSMFLIVRYYRYSVHSANCKSSYGGSHAGSLDPRNDLCEGQTRERVASRLRRTAREISLSWK